MQNGRFHGRVALDWVQTPWEITADAPIVLLIHGLAGGSKEVSDTRFLRWRRIALIVSTLFLELHQATSASVFQPNAMARRDLQCARLWRIATRRTRMIEDLRRDVIDDARRLQTPQAYCGAYTDDLRQVVEAIHRRYPSSPLFAAGYSLGSNILVKYLGEVRFFRWFSLYTVRPPEQPLLHGPFRKGLVRQSGQQFRWETLLIC